MKNIKLLLATTAILAVGATNLNAATDTVNTTLSADIMIWSPFNISSEGGFIHFPSVSTTNLANSGKIKVKVNPDGTVDTNASNAQVLLNTDYWSFGNVVYPIKISGGNLGNSLSAYQSSIATAEATTEAEIAAVGETFASSLINPHEPALDYELSSETIPMIESGGTKPCGEVKSLTPNWRYTATSGGSLELRFGGTFEMADNYTPTNGKAECHGEITVTFIAVY